MTRCADGHRTTWCSFVVVFAIWAADGLAFDASSSPSGTPSAVVRVADVGRAVEVDLEDMADGDVSVELALTNPDGTTRSAGTRTVTIANGRARFLGPVLEPADRYHTLTVRVLRDGKVVAIGAKGVL